MKYDEQLEDWIISVLKKDIYEKLFGRRYLIILEYLLQPLNDPIINNWLMGGWIPLPINVGSGVFINQIWWLISTPSREVWARSFGPDIVFDLELLPALVQYGTLDEELLRVVQAIFSRLACREVTKDILWSCLLYTLLLNGDDISTQNKKRKQNENPVKKYIGAKELIRFWISEGLFTRAIKLKRSRRDDGSLIFQLEEEEEENMITRTDELFESAKTILEALLSSSLVQSCYSYASISLPSPDTPIFPFSGMWHLLNKRDGILFNRVGLLTEDDISDPNKLANKNWISFATDPCKWIEFGNTNKTTTLTLRGRKEISQPIIEVLLFHMPCLRVLDLSYTSIESLPPSLARLTNLRLLSLKHCQNIISLAPDLSTSSPIGTLERLEVLDMHGVPLTEIPDDFGNKKFKIYYLDLSCPKITSLPFNLFSYMESLRELVFLGCKCLTSLPRSIISLANLETLSVSETKLTHLPPDTFKQMLRLRVLKLIDNKLLEKLPKSLCEAQNLEEVELNGCRSLIAIDAFPIKKLKILKLIGNDHMVQLPESLSQSHNLRELTVSDCQSLIEIRMIGHVSLKSFNLSHSPISSLSLRGCRELETVVLHDLGELEELDLSGTSIKELPLGIFGLRRLRKLDVREAPHLERVPWHQLDRVPEVFNLDQCEHVVTTNGDSDAHVEINPRAGVRIPVRDSRLFYGLDQENCRRLAVRGGFLHFFHISVSSCEKRKEKMSRRPSRFIQPQTGASCIYKDVDRFKNLIPMPPPAQQPRDRHVEISSTERKPICLEGILQITESLSVKNNDHITNIPLDPMGKYWGLDNDDYEYFWFPHGQLFPRTSRLMDVEVERCKNIVGIFHELTKDMVNELLNIRAGHLPNLRWLIYDRDVESGADFVTLMHLHVYNCGKLESIFPDELVLPSLETLTITYCEMLQTVFHVSKRRSNVTKNRLQSLRSIRFEELPQIRHIYEEQQNVGPLRVPQWKTLYFRRCWSLRQLPLLEGPRDQQVCVDGEARQCKKIKAQMKQEQLSHYEIKYPPPIASLKDCIKNIIFLK